MSNDPDEVRLPPAAEHRALVVVAAGQRVLLPLAAVRRIEPARIARMPVDARLGGMLGRAVMGMMTVQGAVHGIVSLSVLLGGVQAIDEQARVLCLAPGWLARAETDARGLLRPGLAIMVDRVVDVMHRIDEELDMVLDLAALLACDRRRDDARSSP